MSGMGGMGGGGMGGGGMVAGSVIGGLATPKYSLGNEYKYM
jgi:hypothetical protein